MLSYAILFFLVALAAAGLGFSGIAGTASWIAHVLFVVALVLFVGSIVMHRRTRL